MSDPYGQQQPQPWQPQPQWQQPPPYGYGPQPHPILAAMPRNSGTAVASMVLGIAGILGGFFVLLLPCIAAVVCGHMAKREIRGSNGWIVGDGMATAGLVMGYIPIIAVPVLAIIGALDSL